MKSSFFCCRLALLLASCAAWSAASDEPVRMEVDPSKVLKHEACLKCHGDEVEVWKQTPHFNTFRELHRQAAAQQIAEKMGVKSIKRGGVCIDCHYTAQTSGNHQKPVSGISCESCHGAAQDWVAIHNDYGGPDVSKEAETPEHRRQRQERSIRNGMRNPENIYLIAQSCYGCHTVPNEKLVNTGGHSAGSVGFNLVSWSQGTVRHNFLRGGQGLNLPSSRERLRLMYVVGLMAELEYSLRATANATVKAEYGFSHARRVFDVRRQLAVIQEEIDHPQLGQALDAAYGVKLKLGNQDNLLRAARLVSDAAFQFAARETGSHLSAVDVLLPAESDYK